jgi:hypothetical protein
LRCSPVLTERFECKVLALALSYRFYLLH